MDREHPLEYISRLAESREFKDLPTNGGQVLFRMTNKLAGSLICSIKRLKFNPPNFVFNLSEERNPEGTLCRLETSGSHKNPLETPPSILPAKLKGYRFDNEPHLHLWLPDCKNDNWAIPIDATDFYHLDPFRCMLSALEIYCNFADSLPLNKELYDEIEFLCLHKRNDIKRSS